MDKRTIIVLNPTAMPEVKKDISSASRVHDLDGKVIGFLWNNKPNGDILLSGIREILGVRAGISRIKWHQKTTPAALADAETIEDLVLNCDLVINAIGD